MSLLCYNKGCGQCFDPEQNSDDACSYHSGVPIFHDALKGWSCCRKRTVDFSEFLAIKGCRRGRHSNEKPAETLKPEVTRNKEVPENMIPPKETEFIFKGPKTAEMMDKDRPSLDEPMEKLNLKVSKSLLQALEQLRLSTENKHEETEISSKLTVGTTCKNSGCKQTYQGAESNSDACVYHPGVPVFHEGMKYWSCCAIQTTDFNAFLEQKGCTSGKHTWIKKEDKKFVTCRYDWHQTGSQVVVTAYAKNPVPDYSVILANRTMLSILIVFEGKKTFKKDIDLWGVIDLGKSFVNMLPSKVEINLKKADKVTWGKLEHPNPRIKEHVEENAVQEYNIVEEQKDNDWDISDDSLSWSESEEEFIKE
ncbi:cysteine and histidine-rich domain-containing protein 1-like [Protopterus annectens]|uniref:cysteine and histidine-rich domain-containing protein 1-like n=1 Tax=Protopterus annectens TaxID=7888 RepID=UPI001CFC0583|nr:cysteine and histidine-rich domain-containing protein 1-like [Protopterus annectens]